MGSTPLISPLHSQRPDAQRRFGKFAIAVTAIVAMLLS